MTKKMLMKVFAILEMALCTILPASAMDFGTICMYDDGWYMYGHSVGMTESWSKLLIPIENIGKNDVVEPVIIYGSATPDKIASVKVIADAVMKRDVEAADYADWWEFADSFWPYDEPSSSRKWVVVSMKDSKEWSGAYSFRVGLKGTDLYSEELNIVGFEDEPIKPMDAFGLNITGFQWWGEGYWFESRSDTIILSITVPSAGVLKIDKPFYYRGEDGVKTLKVGGSTVSDVKYGEDLYPYDDDICELEDLTITTSGKGIVTLKVIDDCYFDCANIAFYEGGKESVCISAWADGGQIDQENEYGSGYAGYTRGYVTGGGTFAKGSRVTLTAVPGNGEVFDRWVQLDDDGNEISTVALSEAQLTSPTLSFVVTDSMVGSVKDYKQVNFCATWKEKYDVMGITSPIGAGTISGGGSYVPGSDFVLSVKDLDSLSTFKSWNDNPSITSPVRSIVSENQDVIYTAVYGSLPRLTINCEDGGSVTGGGIFPAGKTVTLKATANKGYVFAGWFTADGEPVSGASDYRSPSYSYVTTGEDITLVAKFIPIADDIADISFTMYDEYKLGMAIEPVLIDVSGCTSLPTVKVTGLPAGLKFTAKPIYKKGSKTEVEVPANTIYGTPTKSGVYTIVVTVTTTGKKTATCSQTVMVVGLPDAIVGTFNGFVKAKDGEENIGTFQFVATDLGKLTAKVITSSGTYTFSATGWSSVEGSVYAVGMETPKGDVLRLSIDSLSRWDENQLTGTFKANGKSEYAVHAKRNAFGNSWYFSADGDAERGWTLSYVPNAILADIIVTLNADGSTKIAGALSDLKVSAAGYADVTSLVNGVIFADFAPVISVKNGKISSKRVLSLRTNLWFDRSNSHIEGVGSARFTE